MAVSLRGFIALISCPAAIVCSGGFNLPLDHARSLRNQEPFPLELEYHDLTAGRERLSFIFPRSCGGEDSVQTCPQSAGWQYRDDAHQRSLSVAPLAGYEFRYLQGPVQEGDFGIQTFGGNGPVSFYLDGRMFTEIHKDAAFPSYDREPVDRQDETASGSIAYASYSRYRSNLDFDWNWGRLTLAHDAIHWGPGQFENLMFQEDAVPFDYLSFTTHLGPINIQSLYGRLMLEKNRTFDTVPDSRSVYAHRYEWNATENLLLGMSEQMILFNHEQPFAFVPLVPLFMTKGDGWERLNNGNLAIDACYRFPGMGMVYSEFLVDDLQAPTSLFDDQWGNKWAWMGGAHGVFVVAGIPAGIVFEYSRVEPWVYTHYTPGTAQAENLGYPLGNQAGPNSQSLSAKAYLRSAGGWYLSARMDCLWKGSDLGSSIDDSHPSDAFTKTFLAGQGSPEVTVTPTASWNRGWLSLQSEVRIGKVTEGFLRIQLSYR